MALVGLTKSAALEYGEKNIRVNIIAPGSFRTPMSERLYGKEIDTPLFRQSLPSGASARQMRWPKPFSGSPLLRPLS